VSREGWGTFGWDERLSPDLELGWRVLRTEARGAGSAGTGRASACAVQELPGAWMLGMLCGPGAGLVRSRPLAWDCTFLHWLSLFVTAPLKVLAGKGLTGAQGQRRVRAGIQPQGRGRGGCGRSGS